MDTCKYVHYEIDSPPEAESSLLGPQSGSVDLGLRTGDGDSNVGKLFPSQVRVTRSADWVRDVEMVTDVFLCSGSAAISDTWTFPSWGSSPW